MTRSTVARLALTLTLGIPVTVVALEVPAAHAQQPAAAPAPTVDLVLPTTPLADGKTALAMHVVAVDANGAPITGLKGKPTVSSGAATELSELGGGVYRFNWTPARYGGNGKATVGLKVKVGGKTSVERSWTVALAAPSPTKATLSATPTRLTMGVEPSGGLAVKIDGVSGRNADLQFRASTGRIDNVTALGEGSYQAMFVAPEVAPGAAPTPPHLAIVTATDRRDPNAYAGATAIPMVSRIAYPFTGLRAGASAIVKLGGREYPPVPVDGNGNARVTIDVAPGAGLATIVQVMPDGARTETPYNLQVPERARWALFPLPAGVPADGRTKVAVRAFVATPDGRPDTAALVKFEATAGTFEPPKHVGDGVYVAMYTPPASNGSAEATLSVSLADRPTFYPDASTLKLLPARVQRLTLGAEPAELAAGATGFKVYAKALGAGDLGLGGRQVNFLAAGATLKEVKDLKNGDYSATFATQGMGTVQVAATLATPESGNPVARVLVLPTERKASTTTPGSLPVRVVAVDAFGYAVPNVAVTLRVASGDGSLPASVTTSADGTALVELSTGRKPGIVNIEATAGDVVGYGGVLQLENASAINVPVSGDALGTSLVADWQGSVPLLRIKRVGADDTITGQMLSTSGDGVRPAKILASTEPAQAVPGAQVTVKVQLLDASGRGVAGQSVDFIPSVGTISGFQDLGSGNYAAKLTLPANAALGDAKVAVATSDGAMTTVVKFPIAKGDANAWGGGATFGAAGAPTGPSNTTGPATTPVPPTVPTPVPAPNPVVVAPPAPSPSSEGIGRFTLAGSFAAYSFDQSPLSTATVLFPYNLDVAASSPGFDTDLALNVPGVAWASVEGGFGMNRYTLDPRPLCDKLGRPCDSADVVSDWISTARALGVGRYAFESAGNRYWLAGKAGWSRSDVQAYKVVGDVIELDQLGVNALAIGPSMGADIGDLVLDATFLEHLAGGTTPWNSEFGANVGYRVAEQFIVGAGYRYNARTVTVSNGNGDPVGDLGDALHAGRIHVGVEF